MVHQLSDEELLSWMCSAWYHLDRQIWRVQAYGTYTFTFDWVYGQDSFQSEVYDKSAKGTVLSALQASHLPVPDSCGPCIALK